MAVAYLVIFIIDPLINFFLHIIPTPSSNKNYLQAPLLREVP